MKSQEYRKSSSKNLMIGNWEQKSYLVILVNKQRIDMLVKSSKKLRRNNLKCSVQFKK